MDLEEQFGIEHLFLTERKCRVCNIKKNLIDCFYRTRRNNTLLSSYSYECKECTIKRIKNSKKSKSYSTEWNYPDW
jgi:hypothetical protein